jgi:hypothetical protein
MAMTRGEALKEWKAREREYSTAAEASGATQELHKAAEEIFHAATEALNVAKLGRDKAKVEADTAFSWLSVARSRYAAVCRKEEEDCDE